MLDLCRSQKKKRGIPRSVNNQGTLSSPFTFLCVMQSLILVIMDKYGSPYIVAVPLNPDVLEISKQSVNRKCWKITTVGFVPTVLVMKYT